MKFTENKKGSPSAAFFRRILLLNDLQDFHGAGLDTDATGDALGHRVALLVDHDLHGADLHALAAADAELLVDHVHTGLGILGDGTGFAHLSALTALNTGHWLCSAVLSTTRIAERS